jgi:micrococcal nuclease
LKRPRAPWVILIFLALGMGLQAVPIIWHAGRLVQGLTATASTPASAPAAENDGEAPLRVEAHTSSPRHISGPVLAEVLRVIDGDTFEARVAIWLGQEITTKIRLAGIDAPELRGLCDEEKRRAVESRDTLARLLEARPVWLADVRADKYGGRVVARALNATGEDIAQMMLKAGQAVAYAGGKRASVCLRPVKTP